MFKKNYKILDVSLARACNFNCSYCNQRYDLTKPMFDMSDQPRARYGDGMRKGDEWIAGLNKFPYKDDYIEVIFSGGEPSIHPDFFDIVSKVKGFRHKKIVTNLSFDAEKLVEACKKENTHVTVQPSFHFEYSNYDEFLAKIKILDAAELLSQHRPMTIVDLNDRQEVKDIIQNFTDEGFPPGVHEFEGYYKGNFEYADVNGFGSVDKTKTIKCRCSCNNVMPNGDLLFCPTDSYLKKEDRQNYGNICDQEYGVMEEVKTCHRWGKCHITSASWNKVKTIDMKETMWTGANYRELNLPVEVAKNVVRPIVKEKVRDAKKYKRYLKSHLYTP